MAKKQPSITVAAHLLIEEAGYPERAFEPNLQAMAQVAIDKGKTLDEVARNAKEYGADVGAYLTNTDVQLPEQKRVKGGMRFGKYKLREPTGFDLQSSYTKVQPNTELAMCFARCSGLAFDKVLALPFVEYMPGAGWLGEELGMSQWTDSLPLQDGASPPTTSGSPAGL